MVMTYQEALPYLIHLSDRIALAYPKAIVTWDTTHLKVSCGEGFTFQVKYVDWGEEEYKKVEGDILGVIEVYT